jgi:hypothetical protein
MNSEKKRPSCRDQFDRVPKSKPEPDEWPETFIARLRALLDRMTGKK